MMYKASICNNCTPYVKDLATLLIQTESDANIFHRHFLPNNHYRWFFATAEFREHKLKNRNPVKLCRFKEQYEQNPQRALQHLFLHPVYAQDLDIVLRKIPSKITLERLHELHTNAPTLQLLRLVR